MSRKLPAATASQTEDLVSIGEVERVTGIRQATLRMWEKRYGFPRPLRDQHGDRVYPSQQVERLRWIRNQLDQGVRPGRILSQSGAYAPGAGERDHPAADFSAAHKSTLDLVRQYRLDALRSVLQNQMLTLGLRRFVIEILGPLTTAVGLAWQHGQLPLRCEHAYSQQVTALLHLTLGTFSPLPGGPTVVLATLSGETHALGILMAQSVLVTHGARCIQLGADTPVAEVAAAALELEADAVALSFSSFHTRKGMTLALADLRAALPAATEIWIGGEGGARLRNPPSGIVVMPSLHAIEAAIAAWRLRDRRGRH